MHSPDVQPAPPNDEPSPSLRTHVASVTRLAASRWDRLLAKLDQLGVDETALLFGFAVVVGLASALGVAAFYRAIDALHTVLYAWPITAAPNIPMAIVRPIITAGAIAIASVTWRHFGRGDDGLTVPDVQLAVVRRGANIPVRLAWWRTLSSAITLGGGGSAGSEGPVAVLGAAVGSLVGRIFSFAAERKRVLVGAGTAAGIAAAFNAPLAGAFFALEEILGSFQSTTFSPVVVASVAGAVLSRAIFGNHPAFPIPREYGFTAVSEVVVFFPLLGVLCGAMSALFVRVHFGTGQLFAKLRARGKGWRAVAPWLAGALVGAAVVASGDILVGTGHTAIPLVMFGRMAWWTLLLLAVGKIVVTAVTLQGGGSGGLFTPSLFVGAATGGALGVAVRALVPSLPIAPEAYALVGMGAVVASATGAPITAILLVFEMTGDYAIVPALMIAVGVSHIVSHRLEKDNLYSGWLRRRGEHLQQGADRDALAGIVVGDAMERDVVLVREDEVVRDLLDHLTHRHQEIFPVVNNQGQLLGVLTKGDLAQAARSGPLLDDLLLAVDLISASETIEVRDTLFEAIRRMGIRGVGALPVTERGTGVVVGIIQRGGILDAYERAARRDAVTSDVRPEREPSLGA